MQELEILIFDLLLFLKNLKFINFSGNRKNTKYFQFQQKSLKETFCRKPTVFTFCHLMLSMIM